MIQILVLAWFAIGLAGRYTGRDRRGDAALLKLRGSSRLGMLRLTVGQHLVPLLAGAMLGAPLGLPAGPARWPARCRVRHRVHRRPGAVRRRGRPPCWPAACWC